MNTLSRWFLWPGDALCTVVGLREENDSRHLLRLCFNLAVWSKVGAVIAVYWVDWGF